MKVEIRFKFSDSPLMKFRHPTSSVIRDGLMKAMSHKVYQAYLEASGLDSTSPADSKAWGAQIKSMIKEFEPAIKEMGLK